MSESPGPIRVVAVRILVFCLIAGRRTTAGAFGVEVLLLGIVFDVSIEEEEAVSPIMTGIPVDRVGKHDGELWKGNVVYQIATDRRNATCSFVPIVEPVFGMQFWDFLSRVGDGIEGVHIGEVPSFVCFQEKLIGFEDGVVANVVVYAIYCFPFSLVVAGG